MLDAAEVAHDRRQRRRDDRLVERRQQQDEQQRAEDQTDTLVLQRCGGGRQLNRCSSF
jgi:hypothetical protein